MVDEIGLSTRRAEETHREFAYEVKRAALGPYVEQVWGWDEPFQQEFHRRDWERRRPDLIFLDGRPIGTIEVERRESEYHLGEFYLLPEFQGRGIGSRLLLELIGTAEGEGVPVRLEVIKINPARAMYERHGFVVVSESDTHFHMVRRSARTV